MLRWSIELCGLDLKFVPRTAIKAQVLSDFLVELSFLEVTTSSESNPPSVKEEVWTMMVDRAVNSKGVGVGIAITFPSQKHERVRSVKLDYPLSNN